MALEIRLTIDDAALRRAVQDPRLIAGPLKDFLAKSAFVVERRAKLLAPRGVSAGGGLQGSIQTRLAPIQAVVFTPLMYAAPVEFGSRPHWPPPGALDRWVRLKVQQKQIRFSKRSKSAQAASEISTKALAFLIARSISRRGTRPHPFMRPAIRRSIDDIRSFLREMAVAIERRWRR